MFKNFRIGARLGLGFGLVLVLMIALATLSYKQMHLLDEEIVEMVNDRFPKTVWVNDVIDQANVIARATLSAMLLNKPDDIQKELNRVPEARKTASEALAKLRQAIASLPERLREVLVLCGVEGLSQEECAELLGCSRRAVEGRLYRARQELAALLGNAIA
ncbi:MAG TPA: sigma-70 family RNA polymerase sigma factor [Rhabdaerophilum sp.]|nr:sigma-70 family RNA polymerase sigma factor [Rhabdaerophilum sp.]